MYRIENSKNTRIKKIYNCGQIDRQINSSLKETKILMKMTHDCLFLKIKKFIIGGSGIL